MNDIEASIANGKITSATFVDGDNEYELRREGRHGTVEVFMNNRQLEGTTLSDLPNPELVAEILRGKFDIVGIDSIAAMNEARVNGLLDVIKTTPLPARKIAHHAAR